MYKIQKNGTEEFIYWATVKKWTENRLMAMGRGEESVRCVERITWKLTLPYAKQIANRNFLYSCLENPKNSMKRQKDRTLKDEIPRLVGAQYAGAEWRNNSRKKEEMEPT